MKALRIMAFAVVGLTVCSAVAQAETLPSFRVEYSSWDATHIVEVAQAIKRDGLCTVLVSWKGDLKKGDVLTFPELADFAAEGQRKVFVFPATDVPPKRVTHVSGLRMVLFLRKGDKGLGDR